MTLDKSYLQYENRRYGMDHDRYEWSMLHRRKPVIWPGDAKVALLIVPALEWFPLDMSNKPFAPPGAMSTAYPDLRHYTLRDYGNRVGIFRLMRVLQARGLKVTAAINAAVAVRYPALLESVCEAGWEVIGHGVDMDHLHHSQLDAEDEATLIRTAVEQLEKSTGQRPRGWLSPAKSQSWATLDLLQEHGVEYCCDWDNDDLPYDMKAGNGCLVSMPVSPDSDDFAILIKNHHTEASFAEQIIDQFEYLHAEAEKSGSGRVMSIALRPWVIGQPYRIGALETALDHILSRDGVWSATGLEILESWQAQ
jgi:allantoinase